MFLIFNSSIQSHIPVNQLKSYWYEVSMCVSYCQGIFYYDYSGLQSSVVKVLKNFSLYWCFCNSVHCCVFSTMVQSQVLSKTQVNTVSEHLLKMYRILDSFVSCL
jgi:hypothetical protein